MSRSSSYRQDYSEDLNKISVPVLAMNGDGDGLLTASGPRAVKLVQNGTLKTYPGFPHGTPTTHADTLNPDLVPHPVLIVPDHLRGGQQQAGGEAPVRPPLLGKVGHLSRVREADPGRSVPE